MFRNIIIFVFLFLSGITWSQVSTSSPYSSTGFGDTKFYGNAYLMGLGGASTALIDSSEVNSFNPSTYASIASHRPLFSLGLNHFETTYMDKAGNSSPSRYTGITHLAFAFPFAKRFGLAFGLKPYSRRGYNIDSYGLANGDSIHYNYSGNGSIYNVFLGFAANVIQDNHHTLSLGVNGMYYFGHVTNERRAYQTKGDGTEVGGLDDKTLMAKALDVELGLNYNYRPNLENSFRIAGVFRPGLHSNFDQSNNRMFYGDFLSPASYDTIVSSGKTSGKIYIPSKMSLGFTYIYTPTSDSSFSRSKYPSYLFTFEYSREDWSNYSEQFSGINTPGDFKNKNSFRFGFEFTPYRYSFRRSSYNGFFDRLKYRVGAYWVNTPYQTGGRQLVDRGVTIGFGIPILMHRSVSSLNISVNYGEMNGGGGAGTFKERYFGFNLGFNIAPGFDKWFQKYKLN